MLQLMLPSLLLFLLFLLLLLAVLPLWLLVFSSLLCYVDIGHGRMAAPRDHRALQRWRKSTHGGVT